MDERTPPHHTQLRILCFGDSLTAGYYHWGLEYHPYAIRLEERLKEKHPSADFQITSDGLPADRVINGLFNSRFTNRLSQDQRYDWILILGYVF